MKDFMEALRNRRSCYAINDQSPATKDQIQEIIDFALLHVPSAFNSQSSRIVVLLERSHKKFWNIVLETLRKIVPADAFAPTEQKISSFAAGYGTILYYEDERVVGELQTRFPRYADRFPTWAQHTSAMHQLAIWTMLENAGLGASLQHYNPIIDNEVRETWSLDPQWTLVAQMPFGGLVKAPDEKEFQPLDARRKAFD
ncbi:MAG: nitroreductase family protein [Synergistaceae bacterium]|nr:nitroreductase family protein [Synergistaceae bacterium]